jgi:hypothetical protein
MAHTRLDAITPQLKTASCKGAINFPSSDMNEDQPPRVDMLEKNRKNCAASRSAEISITNVQAS